MKILEGRSTSIKIPGKYVNKLEEYVQPLTEYLYKKDVSGLVEELIQYNSVNDNFPYDDDVDGEKVYINQNAYRDFVAKAKNHGYKNGLECLKAIINEKEQQALQYGNDKKPEDNPFALEIGGSYYNLAKTEGLLITGDIQSNKDKLANYIVNQLARKNKGDETDIYEVIGDECYHKTKGSPFEIEESINTSDFFDWLESLVEQRLKFLKERGYSPFIAVTSGYGLNMNLPHNFSRTFIVVDRDKLTEPMLKRLNNLCRINNEINRIKLFGLDIHIIAKVSREYLYEAIDSNVKNSFLDCTTALLETDGEDIAEGEEIALTWRYGVREMVNVKGLFY